jgi:hypothetical protein
MYDAGKIIPGLVIFLGLITLPVWYDAATGKGSYTPEPEIVTEAKQCVLPTPDMREKHMELLNEWRQSAVRDGERNYLAADGQSYNISLTGTCLKCHSNKAQFCDRCHSYAGAQPNCWECHVVPEGESGGS